MPNRVIREGILTSEKIARIADDPATEVFFRRMLNVVDDYGRYFAHPALLRSACYPFSLDLVTDADVLARRDRCVAVDLLELYVVDGKEYIEVPNFRQQLRAKRSKYPSVSKGHRIASDAHMPIICVADAHQSDTQMRSEAESEAESEARQTSDAQMPSKRTTGATHFQPDLNRFEYLYPKPISQLEQQLFISLARSPDDEDSIFASLAAHKRLPNWQDPRYVPSAKRFLGEGMWRTVPVIPEDTGGPVTPTWRPEDYD